MRLPEIASENQNIEPPRQARWSAIAASCQGILDAVPAAAYTCDASGLITYFNPVAEAIWGRAPKLHDWDERYCGSHRLYSLDGAAIRHEECWMALALRQGHPYNGREIVIERRDGTRTVGEAYAHPLRNAQGQIVGALNLVADITGLRGNSLRYSKLQHPSIAYSATLAMIEIAVSILTLMTWENCTFN